MPPIHGCSATVPPNLSSTVYHTRSTVAPAVGATRLGSLRGVQVAAHVRVVLLEVVDGALHVVTVAAHEERVLRTCARHGTARHGTAARGKPSDQLISPPASQSTCDGRPRPGEKPRQNKGEGSRANLMTPMANTHLGMSGISTKQRLFTAPVRACAECSVGACATEGRPRALFFFHQWKNSLNDTVPAPSHRGLV